jgi:hypothetical protein
MKGKYERSRREQYQFSWCEGNDKLKFKLEDSKVYSGTSRSEMGGRRQGHSKKI